MIMEKYLMSNLFLFMWEFDLSNPHCHWEERKRFLAWLGAGLL